MQTLHDSVIVEAGNASASLDPAQAPNDANDKLIKGAAAFAAGRTLGLSEDEVYAALQRQARKERRTLIGPQRETEQQTINDLVRQAEQAKNALGKTVKLDSDRPGFVTFSDDFGLSREEREYEAAAALAGSSDDLTQGFDPTSEQTLRQGDRAYVGPDARDAREERAEEQDAFAAERRRRYEASRERQGLKVFKNQPTSLAKIFGADTEGETGDLTGAIRAMTADEMIAERAAQRETVANLGAIERERLNRADNRAAESSEAQYFPGYAEVGPFGGNQTYGAVEFDQGPVVTSGAMPKGRITGISPVRFYGSQGAGPSVSVAPPVPNVDAAKVEGIYIDPRSGLPVETTEPAVAVAGSNTPTTAQMLNAPPIQSASDFVAKMTTEGSINTGDVAYPQVSVSGVLGDLDARINRLSEGRQVNGRAVGRFVGLRDRIPAQIDSIDALQKTVDAVVSMAAAKGKPLARMVGSKREVVENPGVMEVLDALGVKSDFEKEQIALALKARAAGGPTWGFEPGDPRLQSDALPLKRGVELAKMGKNSDLSKAIRAARIAGGGELDEETLSLLEGRRKGDAAAQTTVSVGPASDVEAIKRLQYMDDKIKRQARTDKVTGEELSLLQNAATFLRERRGIAQPTFEQAMAFLEEVKTQQNVVLDEESLARTVARTEGVASRAVEDEAMARLLAGPLAPGGGPPRIAAIAETPRPVRARQQREAREAAAAVEPTSRRREMTEGVLRALQAERAKDREPLPQDDASARAMLAEIARRGRR